LFIVVFALWGVIVFDPTAKVQTTPSSITSESGGPMFANRSAVYTRAYWMVHSLLCLCFDARLLEFARVNPKFSLLAETFDNMLGRLLNFVLVLVLLILIFSGEAMILFGDRVPGFDSYGLCIIQCIFMALGTSGRGGARRNGGGAGTPMLADYNSLSASSEIAPLFYFPFIFLITFVIFNITVAIIGDSYNEIKRRQDPKGPKFEGAPSEQRTGKTVTLWYQMKRGVHRRLTNLRLKSEDPCALSKDRILKMCHELKTRNARAAEAKAKLDKADAQAQHAEAALVSAAHCDASGKPGEEPPAQTGLAHAMTRTDDLVAKECLSLVDLECLTYKEFVLELKRVHEHGDAYVDYCLHRLLFA